MASLRARLRLWLGLDHVQQESAELIAGLRRDLEHMASVLGKDVTDHQITLDGYHGILDQLVAASNSHAVRLGAYEEGNPSLRRLKAALIAKAQKQAKREAAEAELAAQPEEAAS